jgi:hemolysin III
MFMDWLHFREPVSAWTHGIWFLLAFPASLLLWRAGRGDRIKQISLLIFGLSLIICFAGSVLYHALRLHPQIIEGWFAKADSIGIYLLIAGSITPVAVVVLQGAWRTITLASIWLMAAGGSVVCLSRVHVPAALSTSLYLAMGWGITLSYFQLKQNLPPRALGLAVLGGLLYSAGAVFNLLHWPVLQPGVFAAHELFHLFVMAGSLVHFWFMVKVVAPMERSVETCFIEPVVSEKTQAKSKVIFTPAAYGSNFPPRLAERR